MRSFCFNQLLTHVKGSIPSNTKPKAGPAAAKRRQERDQEEEGKQRSEPQLLAEAWPPKRKVEGLGCSSEALRPVTSTVFKQERGHHRHCGTCDSRGPAQKGSTSLPLCSGLRTHRPQPIAGRRRSAAQRAVPYFQDEWGCHQAHRVTQKAALGPGMMQGEARASSRCPHRGFYNLSSCWKWFPSPGRCLEGERVCF